MNMVLHMFKNGEYNIQRTCKVVWVCNFTYIQDIFVDALKIQLSYSILSAMQVKSLWDSVP